MKEIRDLINRIKEASFAYYNTAYPLMSDSEFDELFHKLEIYEEETGIVYFDSPTINVGSSVLPGLTEAIHTHDMLSLAKCHTENEIMKFAKNQTLVAMTKCDGLTVTLRYEDGHLVSAQTRGDGKKGIDCTQHLKQFRNVPFSIPISGIFEVDGEAIIKNKDFAIVNKNGEFKNARNLAAGTLNSLDTSLTKSRRISFIAWDCIRNEKKQYNTFSDCLDDLESYGFEVVPHLVLNKSKLNENNLREYNEHIMQMSKDIPYDGVVWKFDDVMFGKSLGKTSHHFNNGIAYKFKDDSTSSILRNITWNAENKTGVITPVAEFDPVELEGTEVSKATLHNISIMKELKICIGKEITVIKANQIIPRITSCDSTGYSFEIPKVCPICGKPTSIVKQNNSEVLVCPNNECRGKWLGKLIQYSSKDAMDIDGLSEQTLRLFLNLGWLNSYSDFYTLKNHKREIQSLPGFGLKSTNNLLDAIEKSRKTTLPRLLISLSIPNVGKHVSNVIGDLVEKQRDNLNPLEYFINNYHKMKLEKIDGIGDVIIKSLYSYLSSHKEMIIDLGNYLEFDSIAKQSTSSDKLSGMTFVITGTLEKFKNRNELVSIITSNGGKVSGSVSKNTTYLINNDSESGSSKNKKARSLGINIITEEEFIRSILENE